MDFKKIVSKSHFKPESKCNKHKLQRTTLNFKYFPEFGALLIGMFLLKMNHVVCDELENVTETHKTTFDDMNHSISIHEMEKRLENSHNLELYESNQAKKRLSKVKIMSSYLDNSNHELLKANRERLARSENGSAIRRPFNANSESLYVELMFVVDNDIYTMMKRDVAIVHQYCKEIAINVNAIYNPLNIFVVLVAVDIWKTRNEIQTTHNSSLYLHNFQKYSEKYKRNYRQDHIHLLTIQQFNKTIGAAFTGDICSSRSVGFSNGARSDIKDIVSTVSHELGHSLGMTHDDSCKCDFQSCIMREVQNVVPPTHWTQCNRKDVDESIKKDKTFCLENQPTKSFQSPTCGNGFMELGEECDCGLPNVCQNKCCNPKTCKLQRKATCATGECCDLSTCRLHESGRVCRPSKGDCDLPEYCRGNSEFCPNDFFKQNSEPCKGGMAYCYDGLCKTHNDSCTFLFGSGAMSDEKCHEHNTKGLEYGYCRYDQSREDYVKCNNEDILCGLLHCSNVFKGLQITGSWSTLDNCNQIVRLDIHEYSNLAFAQDGFKCGVGKMCLNRKCVSVDSLSSGCSNNCDNHGVCNNVGQCHCDKGYAPPLCNSPGSGGSISSGPMSTLDEPNLIAVYVALGVLIVGVIVLLSFYLKRKGTIAIFNRGELQSPVIVANSTNLTDGHRSHSIVENYPVRTAPAPPPSSKIIVNPKTSGNLPKQNPSHMVHVPLSRSPINSNVPKIHQVNNVKAKLELFEQREFLQHRAGLAPKSTSGKT